MQKLLITIMIFIMVTPVFGKNFMWEVKKGKSKMHLLGSVHVAKPELYKNGRLNEPIMKAFEQSKSLVVEVDITKENSLALQTKVMLLGMYKDKTLKDVLKPATYKKLSEVAANVGIPMMMLDKMKPWLASLTVALMEMKKLGYDENSGIDLYFLKKAHCENKEKTCKPKKVVSLETGEFQMNLIASFEEKIDILNLEVSLKNWDKIKTVMNTLFEDWKQGKTKSMEEFIYQGEKIYPELKVYNKKMLTDRNKEMVKKLDKMLKTPNGNYFVIVGAGHLVGKEGLINLLKKKGYKVTQK